MLMDTAVLENIPNNSITYQNNLEVISCTLNDLLFSNQEPISDSKVSGQITIPEYQHPYVWKEK